MVLIIKNKFREQFYIYSKNHTKPILGFMIISIFFPIFALYIGSLDWDTLFFAIIPSKIPGYLLNCKENGCIYPNRTALLLPLILHSLSGFIPSLIAIYIIFGFSIFFTLIGIYSITYFISSNKFMATFASLTIFSFFHVRKIIISMDDNFIPLPFILGIVLLFLIKNNTNNFNSKYYFSIIIGVLYGISCSFHVQNIILLPLIIWLIIQEKDSNLIIKIQQVSIILTITIIIYLIALIPFIPGILEITNGNILNSTFGDQRSFYKNLLTNPNWYLFAKNRSINELLAWIGSWMINSSGGMFNIIDFDFNTVLLKLVLKIDFYFELLILMILFLSMHGLPILLYKKFSNKEKYFVKIYYLIFLCTLIFTFFYESNSGERWIHVYPLLVIVFTISINKLILTIKNQIKNSKKHKFQNEITFPLFFVSIFVLIIILMSLIITIDNSMEDSFPEPGSQILLDIVKKTPRNTLIIFGEYPKYGLITYFYDLSNITVAFCEEYNNSHILNVFYKNQYHFYNNNISRDQISSRIARNKTILLHSTGIECFESLSNKNQYILTEIIEYDYPWAIYGYKKQILYLVKG